MGKGVGVPGVQGYRGTGVQSTGVQGYRGTGVHGYRGTWVTGVTGAIGVQAVKCRMSSELAQKLRQCTYSYL